MPRILIFAGAPEADWSATSPPAPASSASTPLGPAWRSVVADLQPNQRAWLNASEPVTLHGNTAIIAVPNDFTRGQLEGRLEPLDAASVRRAFFGVPLMSFGVIARIHWQALRLWRGRVPLWKKPVPPQAFVTRSAP